MTLLRSLLLLSVIAVLAACAQLPVSEPLPRNFDAGSVLVVIDDPRPQRRRQRLLGSGYSKARNYSDDPSLGRAAKAIADSYNTVIEYQWPIESIGAHCFVIHTDSPALLIGQLQTDERVRYAYAVNRFRVKADSHRREGPDADDSSSDIALKSHGRPQRIAVIDTSADLMHPDLPHRRVNQWDLVGPFRGRPKERHGTAVLGLIAATPMNGIGIDGAAPYAEYGVFRGCWQLDAGSADAECDSVSLALALQSAYEWGADVINLSLTGPRDLLLEEIVSTLLARGSVVVAAFDEERHADNRFPHSRPGVIHAYGKGVDDRSGPHLNAIALGTRDALTLQPDASYNVLSGHSMAAPIVSACVAKVRESAAEFAPGGILDTLRRIEGRSDDRFACQRIR